MPEKKPDRFTKSIVLAGGIQEDAPELLRQLPSLAYIENGRFRKLNEVEKTLPEKLFDSLANTKFLCPVDNGLLVGRSFGLTEVDTEATTKHTIAPKFAKSKLFAGSTVVSGACNFGWSITQKPGEDPIYVIAYELRQGWPGSHIESAVIVEGFDEDGKIVRRKKFGTALTPTVNTNDLGDVLVHYTLSNGSLFCYNYGDDTTRDTGISVYKESDQVRAIFDPTSDLSIKGYNAIRFGFSPSGTNANFQVHFPGYGWGHGAILYQDETTRYLWVARLDDNGIAEGIDRLIEVSTDSVSVCPHDVMVVGTGFDSKVWIMYSQRDNSPMTSSITVGRGNLLLTSFDYEQITSGAGETVINARFVEGERDTDQGLFLAYTIHHETENIQTLVSPALAVGVELRYGMVSDAMQYTEWEHIYDHVLTSNPVYDKGADAAFPAYFTCQQMVTAEPYSPTKDYGRVSIPISTLKPVTTYLVGVKYTGTSSSDVEPIAVFDVNSSKHMNPSMQEQQARVCRLAYVGDDLMYLNRKVLQGEDASFYVMSQNNFDQTAGNFQKRNSTVGEYKGNLYKIVMNTLTTTPDNLKAIPFGGGAIINSSVPIFYSSGQVQELGVLEQPEILTIYQEGDLDELNDANCWCYVTPVDDDVEKWITVQIVIGFVDSLGFVHRSAPSFPVFVRGIRPEDTTNLQRVLKFTYPITRTDIDYFVEVYEAAYGEVPQLATVVSLSPKSILSFREQISYDGAVKYRAAKNKELYPIRNSEFVYTTGDVLAADPWEDFDFIVETSRRFFVSRGSTLYFSKLFEENTAPEMNALLSIPFGRNKTITALGKIDDKVIVFERDAIHAVYGDGPDNTGQGAPFVVDRIQTTVGCNDAKSLVEIPEGLIFYSDISDSFHILTRDFEIVDIGGPVMDLASDITITAATLFPMESEVRWYVTAPAIEEFGPEPEPSAPPRPPRPRFQNVLPSGAVLVFNYGFNKWTVLSGQSAVDVALLGNEIVRTDGEDMYITCEDWWNSNLLKYRTPWVQVQDLQNHGRIDKVALLGQYLSSWTAHNGSGVEAGDIKITSRYNYEEFGNSHEYRWRANDHLSHTQGERLQISFRPGQPKCQAIQLTIEEVPTEKLDFAEPSYANGRGFVLSGLDIQCKPKRGFGDKSLGQKRSK